MNSQSGDVREKEFSCMIPSPEVQALHVHVAEMH
jgi:hypothetical protein